MSRTHLFCAALLLALVFVAYSPGFDGPLLFDDYSALRANPLLQIDGTVFDEWRTAALSSRSGPLRRPVAMFSFALNTVAAGGVSVFWIKLVNTLIHLATGALLYLLALPLFARLDPGADANKVRWLALLTAAIWLLHPLHVSTVLYAVQRMAQLAALFTVLGLLVYVRYRQRWARCGASLPEVLAAALWLLLLTAGAAYSKENGALLPGLILVVEVCFFRGAWAGRQVAALQRAGAALLALSGLALLLCMVAAPDFLSDRFHGREFTLHERVLTQARILWHYLWWLVLPDISAMGFQHDDIELSRGLLQPVSTLAAVVAWGAALAVAIALRRRYPLLLFALLFYLMGHSMESSVLPLELVYEHRNYLPSMGLCMLLASLLLAPLWRDGPRRYRGWLLAAGVPLLLSVLLLIRVDTWSDGLRLAGVNASNHPDSSRSSYFYANALLQRYRDSADAGLSRQEAADALLGARYYFEKMYDANPRDVAALVMLHSLDAQFAPNAPDARDWLAELEALLETRVLQASDINAMAALIDCVNAGGCAADRERILAMLDTLERRYPRNLQVLGWRYTYLLGQGAAPGQLDAILDRALAINPGQPEFLLRLIEQRGAVGDVGGMYAAAGQWLLHDTRRLRLGQIKALFSVPGAAQEGKP
ncbi:MAG: hypothetical protein KDI01_05300 [Halioglobus sp.]|nr:hypothetical protein [Halioglobus sp.]